MRINFLILISVNLKRRIEVSCRNDLRLKRVLYLKNGRLNWIKEGTGYSKFFYDVVKDGSNNNHNDSLDSNSGVRTFDPKPIKQIILEFYKGLMGTIAPIFSDINFQAVRKGPHVGIGDAQMLTSPVFEMEVKDVLFGWN